MLDQAAPRPEQAGLFHTLFLTVAKNDGNQGAAVSRPPFSNLAPKAQHSERAWGYALG